MKKCASDMQGGVVSGKMTRGEGFLLVLWVLLALVSRLALLIVTDWVIDSDEAIVGLMGKHIAEGRGWPIFYYGQPYMGSIESTLAALVFLFTGPCNIALKAVPLVFSIALVPLAFFLARRLSGAFAGHLAAVFVAIGPAALVHWSGMARGGFIELVALGTLAFMLAGPMLAPERPGKGTVFALGVVLGLMWWMNNQSIFYLVAIALIVAIHYLCCFDWRGALSDVGLVLVGFFLGGGPFWYYNLVLKPHYRTFEHLSGGVEAGAAFEHFSGFLFYSLPILTGGRRFWSREDIFTGSSLIVCFAYFVLLAAPLLVPRVSVFHPGASKGEGVRQRLLLGRGLYLFLILTPVIFSLSKFGYLFEAPRYLLPLYTVLPVLVAAGAVSLWRSSVVILRLLSFVSCGLIICVHGYSQYQQLLQPPGQPFVYGGERVASDHREVLSLLKQRGVSHLQTNYWIGYRLAFESEETITFSRFNEPRSLRISEYESCQPQCLMTAPYLLTVAQAGAFAKGLGALGYRFQVEKVGTYMLLSNVRPVSVFGRSLSVSDYQVTATNGQELLEQLRDGNRETRWGSGAPQAPGMKLSVSFVEPQRIAGMVIDHGEWNHDRSRGMVIEGIGGDGTRHLLLDTVNNYAIDSEDPRLELHFSPLELVGVELTVTAGHEIFDWSVAELEFFQSAD
ncbi:MAG: hypothetical protein PHC51_12425 [bacterium]|nr:hypothetical protein [bacterium]